VRLQAERAPDLGDGRPLSPDGLSEAARAPVRAVGWHLLEGGRDGALHVGVAHAARGPDARVVAQPASRRSANRFRQVPTVAR
jgi:hypothetical protein